MELLPKPLCRTLNRYWRKRQYHRIDGEARGRRKVHVTRFHGGPSSWKWRIRVPRRLRVIGITALSPLKLWAKFKSSYMNMMFNLAGRVGCLRTKNVFGAKRIPKSRSVSVHNYSDSEVEQRLVVEIYKALQILSPNDNRDYVRVNHN